jgi:hypothetical protein
MTSEVLDQMQSIKASKQIVVRLAMNVKAKM